MAINTNFNPANISEFEKSKLNKDAAGVSTTVPALTTHSLDLLLVDDTLMAGGNALLVKGAIAGDTVDFQVVHPVHGVENQFVTSWYINPDSTAQQLPTSTFPAKLFAGLTLRVVYHSTGPTDVWIAMNYNKEKVLE
jgi:hypothetical protein